MFISYLGSKTRLVPILGKILNKVINECGQVKDITFGDFFAGTGTITQFMSTFGGRIICNDIELYSWVLNKATCNIPFSKRLQKIICYLNGPHLKPVCGLIWKSFSPKGNRMVFTEENAKIIDGLRISMSELFHKNVISFDEYVYLLACLIYSCDKFANVASCYRAYLKHWCLRSKKKFVLKSIHTNTKLKHNNVKVVMGDALKTSLNFKCDIAYLDPPYNSNHYGAHYSFYNYLLRYDKNQLLQGVPGILNGYYKSKFGLKQHATQSLVNILSNLKMSKFVVMSYSEDGIMQKDDIIDIMQSFGNITVYKLWNKKFKTHSHVKMSHVKEYIFVLKVGDTLTKEDVKEIWV